MRTGPAWWVMAQSPYSIHREGLCPSSGDIYRLMMMSLIIRLFVSSQGAGRVAFSNQQSYIAAISARFVQLQHGDIDKRVEVKPYVLDDQMCDECAGARCGSKFAPFFCANVTCLQYYCEHCWATIHSRPGREFHKPLVKEGADRPRAVPFRWC
ncbi:hypothetical protein evm_008144 [Chilo suppressalis]|nr:hypothetical protein evm_008144 [Chilo suppressalis]